MQSDMVVESEVGVPICLQLMCGAMQVEKDVLLFYAAT